MRTLSLLGATVFIASMALNENSFAADASPWSFAGEVSLGFVRTDNALNTPSQRKPDIVFGPEVRLVEKYHINDKLALSFGIDEYIRIYNEQSDAGIIKPNTFVGLSYTSDGWTYSQSLAQDFVYDQSLSGGSARILRATTAVKHDFVIDPKSSRIEMFAAFVRSTPDFSTPGVANSTFKIRLTPNFDIGETFNWSVATTLGYSFADSGNPAARLFLADVDLGFTYRIAGTEKSGVTVGADLEFTKAMSNIPGLRYVETTIGPSIKFTF